MKRILCCVLCLSFLLVLSGCGKDPDSSASHTVGQVSGILANLSPDPVSVVLSVADKELRETADSITEEGLNRFGLTEAVKSIALGFKQTSLSGKWTPVLYSLMPDSPDQTVEGLYRDVQSRINSAMNAYGTDVMAANAVIRSLNTGNSYCFPQSKEDLPLYLVEEKVEGRTIAFVVCMFNNMNAIETSVFPVPITDIDLTFSLYSVPSNIRTEEIPDLSSEDRTGIIQKLKPVRGVSYDAEALTVSLANRIAKKAVAPYLQSIGVPDEIFANCSACRIFAGNPSQTIRLDLQKSDLYLDHPELHSRIGTLLPSMINGLIGQNALAAQGVMSVSTACSGLNTEDAVYWLFFQKQAAPFCCVVVTKNKNDCYDVCAAPLYYSYNFAESLVQSALENGLSTEDMLVKWALEGEMN